MTACILVSSQLTPVHLYCKDTPTHYTLVEQVAFWSKYGPTRKFRVSKKQKQKHNKTKNLREQSPNLCMLTHASIIHALSL